MSKLTDWMDRTLYPNHADRWDDRTLRSHLDLLLEPTDCVLDLGAGAGIIEALRLRDAVAEVCGVDPDPRVLENPHLDDARVGFGEAIPYDDERFDLAMANNVLEHLERPAEVLAEVARVLRPGGRFVAKTPNRTHYIPLASRLTPHRFHQWYNGLRGMDADDIYPTHYRANTAAAIRREAAAVGLEVERIERIEGRPEYLRLAAPLYACGYAYERVVNATEVFAPLRSVIVCVLRKPDVLSMADHREEMSQAITRSRTLKAETVNKAA